MKKEFIGINHGIKAINLRNKGRILQMRPTEIHLKENGSAKNEPSFAILLEPKDLPFKILGQISLEMFNEGLNDIGYEIVKKQ
jgi:hypothetical protein